MLPSTHQVMEPFCEVLKVWSQFLSGRQANENWSLSNFRPRNAEADVNSSGSSVPPHTHPHTDPQQLGTLVVVWSRLGFIDCMYLKTEMEFHPGTVSQTTLFSLLLLYFFFVVWTLYDLLCFQFLLVSFAICCRRVPLREFDWGLLWKFISLVLCGFPRALCTKDRIECCRDSNYGCTKSFIT